MKVDLSYYEDYAINTFGRGGVVMKKRREIAPFLDFLSVLLCHPANGDGKFLNHIYGLVSPIFPHAAIGLRGGQLYLPWLEDPKNLNQALVRLVWQRFIKGNQSNPLINTLLGPEAQEKPLPKWNYKSVFRVRELEPLLTDNTSPIVKDSWLNFPDLPSYDKTKLSPVWGMISGKEGFSIYLYPHANSKVGLVLTMPDGDKDDPDPWNPWWAFVLHTWEDEKQMVTAGSESLLPRGIVPRGISTTDLAKVDYEYVNVNPRIVPLQNYLITTLKVLSFRRKEDLDPRTILEHSIFSGVWKERKGMSLWEYVCGRHLVEFQSQRVQRV
jgi:hypothetical protein